MKQIFFAFLFVFVASCSSSNSSDSDNSNTSDSGGTSTQYSIIGAWSNTDQTTQCVTEFIFNSDLTFTISSLDNLMSGTFTTESTALSPNKLKLLLNVETDNALSNCDGESFSDAGNTLEVYFNFSDANTLNIFENYYDPSPALVLTK